MSNISDLAALVGKAAADARKKDKLAVGTVTGDYVTVNGRSYRPTWGGDFNAKSGDRVDCIVDGNKCLVMRASR